MVMGNYHPLAKCPADGPYIMALRGEQLLFLKIPQAIEFIMTPKRQMAYAI